MTLTILHDCKTETGKLLRAGDVVGYIAHVPGGMVKVLLLDGTTDVIHPQATAELKIKPARGKP